FQAAAGQAGRPNAMAVARRRAVNIGQNDLTGSIGASLLETRLNLDVTKSFYDKDLGAINARAAQAVRLSGLGSTIHGFPNLNASARLELRALPLLTPAVTYVHTKYKLSQPDSNAVIGSVYAELGVIELSASVERLAQ